MEGRDVKDEAGWRKHGRNSSSTGKTGKAEEGGGGGEEIDGDVVTLIATTLRRQK